MNVNPEVIKYVNLFRHKDTVNITSYNFLKEGSGPLRLPKSASVIIVDYLAYVLSYI